MSETPLVSVCMAGYNAARFLERALKSVLAQTYPAIEIVFVDDGSTDGTLEVARSVGGDRARYFRNESNRGGYQAMNRAIGEARGSLLAVYHSDDIYGPGIVEREVAFLTAHPQAGAVFCLDDYIDDEDRVIGRTTMPEELRKKELLTYDDVFPFLLRRKNVLFRCPTFLTRRATLDAVGLFDAETFDIAADLDLWIRIARRYPVGILDERLMSYRFGDSRWSNRYRRLRTEPELFFPIMDRYLEVDGWRSKLGPDDLTEYAFHRCDDETFRAANFVIRGDPAAARALLAHPYPWRTLAIALRRRKLRVLLLRWLLRAGLALRASRLLSRLLIRTEYGGRL
jgi:glycosyltransferase involved in cell wall biosynthesis